MTMHVVRVDGAGPSSPPKGSEVLDLATRGPARNVLIEPDKYVEAALTEIPARLRDLFLLAGSLYAADARIRRGTVTDVFNDAWRRQLELHVPVHEPAFWARGEVVAALQNAVGFLTGDDVKFVFHPNTSKPTATQSLLPANLQPPGIGDADVVVLLSGGLDSLAAVLEARANGARPLLVSHRPAPQLKARQDNVVALLRQRDPSWSFPHLSILVHAVKGQRPVEFTQRSRSFLYAALGAVAVQLSKAAEMHLCDNGVVSLNLPPSGQSVGTTLSRSTHPGYLRRLDPLLRLVLGPRAPTIRNTLEFHTKREVVEVIAKRAGPELVQETVSCAHTEGRTRAQPHCGACTQCIDRRFATTAAGLQAHDLPARYERDVFVCDLKDDALARAHVENYLRFAHDLARYTTAAAFATERLSDLDEALPVDGVEDYVQRVYAMFERHQRDVDAVVTEQVRVHAPGLAWGRLPEVSLLRLVARADHVRPPREVYVDRLARLFAKTLPTTFASNPPKDERAMQDAGHAALLAAQEPLAREAPQVPFGTIGVRPDFSKTAPNGDALFVEFKLVKDKKDRNRTHGEMAKDLIQYPDGCWILFVVFDPKRGINDDEAFRTEFMRKRANVAVQIVR